MAIKLGWFDPTARALTWFDETAVKDGWFDVTNIPDGATSPDVTIVLTGQSVTTSAGTLGVKNDKAITGQSVTTNQGTITAVIGGSDVTIALTGIAVTTSQGTLGVKFDVVNAGQSATASQGTLGVKQDKDLSGQSAAASQGTLGVKFDNALAGQSSTTQQGTLGVSIASGDITLQLVGQSVGTSVGTIGTAFGLIMSGQLVTTAQGTLTVQGALPVTITAESAQMLMDIWQRFGLDSANPLVEDASSALFGTIALSKTGTSTITSTRAGTGATPAAIDTVISDTWQRLGLDPANPMVTDGATITAGSVSQTVSGATTVTVTVTRV